MKRFAFLTIVLIVIALTGGCRRGLRLWGVRGAPCWQTTAAPAAAAPTMAPPTYAAPAMAPPAYAAPCLPPCPCPPVCPTCPTPSYQPVDCGCAVPAYSSGPSYSDPGYASPGYGDLGLPAGGQIVSDTGYNLQPGETLGSAGMMDGGATGIAPANIAPSIMDTPPVSGFSTPIP